MATTFTPKILKHQRKSNGTYPVVYRLTHNRKSRYIKTRHYIDDSQITGKDDIHIDFIIDHLSDDLKKYRKKIAEIENIELMTVDEVKDIVIGKKTHIDFKAFVKLHIDRLKGEGRNGTAKPFVTVLNSLNDYVNGELPTFMITSKFLEKYEIYLRTPKKVKRQQGSVLAERNAQLNDKGLNNHMAAFRTLFNAARDYYNDEDTGKILIKNNPFSKYRIKPKKGKEHKNLSIETIREIRDFEPDTRLENVGFKMFMLSFYLCGMNAVDIFKNWEKLKELPERIGYNRSKTENKREDGAFISVKLPEQAKKIILGFEMTQTTSDTLNKEISLGIISGRKKLGIEKMTMLYARHSFATIARNDLNISRDDVAAALNHVSQDSRITDTYLAPDWSKIDRVQDAVIKKINEDLEEV